MTGCSMAAKRMGNDLITGKQKIGDVSNSMKTATASTKALGVAMNVFANVGFMLAITAVTKVITELAQAQSKAVEAAQEATEAYKGELTSLEEYKTKVSELHEELNSENISYEESKTIREELLVLQDELIQKYGNEKTAIENITTAIKGEVDALDELNEKAYRDWVAKADETTFWNISGKSGLDQAIDYMETDQTVSFYDMQNANLSDELQAIQKEIDETIRAKYGLEKQFATFKLTGTPEEIRKQLENIRQDYIDISENVFLREKLTGEWDKYREEAISSINEVLLKLDEGLGKHQETYQTYIEGMIKYDSEYSDEYANILQKRAELESAQSSGNQEEIQKAKQSFMDAINEGIASSSSNENVKKYFESLYPELQSEFSNWVFEFDLKANVKGLKDMAAEIGEQYTAVDLLDMVNTEGTQEGEDAFNSLIDKAIEYGVCTDNSAEEVQKLIDLLVELGIVQGNVQGSTSDNEITDSFINTLNSADYAEIKDELLELAKSGEITPETLSSTEEYAELLSKTETSAESATNQILDMLSAQEKLAGFSQGLDKLKSAYEEFKDEDIGFVTAETLQSLPDAFKNLPEFDLFSQIVGDPTSGAGAIQQAFNDIVKAYMLSQDVLQGLVGASEHDIQSYIANFKQMGVTNAEEVVNLAVQALNTENELINAAEAEQKVAYERHLADKNYDYERYLENTSSQNTALKNALGETYKADYDNWCELLHDKAEAYNQFIKALEESGIVYDSSKSVQENAQNAIKKEGYSPSEIDRINRAASNAELSSYLADKQKQALQLDLSQITTNFGTSYSPSNGSNGSGSGSSPSEVTQEFNWIEKYLESFARRTEKIMNRISDYLSFKKNLSTIKSAIKSVRSELFANEQALAEYAKQMNAIGLDAKYVEKIKNGALEIETITGYETDGNKDANAQLIEKIEKYQDLYDKYTDIEDTIEDLRETEKEWLVKNLEYVNEYYQKLSDIKNLAIDKKQDNIDLKEAQGKKVTTSDYKKLVSNNSAYIKSLRTTYKKTNAEFNKLVKNGTIEKNSAEWFEWKENLADLNSEIVQAQINTAEWKDEINQIKIDNYTSSLDRLQAKYDKLNTTISRKEKSNIVASKSDYNKVIKNLNQQITKNEKLLALYKKLQSETQKNSKKWREYQGLIEDTESSVENLRDSIIETAEKKADIIMELRDKSLTDNENKSNLWDAKYDNATSASERNKILDEKDALAKSNYEINQKAYEDSTNSLNNLGSQLGKYISDATNGTVKTLAKDTETELQKEKESYSSYQNAYALAQAKYDKAKTKAEKSSAKTEMENLSKIMSESEQKIKNLESALTTYNTDLEANQSVLSQLEGYEFGKEIDLSKITDKKILEVASEYNQTLKNQKQALIDAGLSEQEAIKILRENASQRIQNCLDEYEALDKLNKVQRDNINAKISLNKTQGYAITDGEFETYIKSSQESIKLAQEKVNEAQAEFDKNLANGVYENNEELYLKDKANLESTKANWYDLWEDGESMLDEILQLRIDSLTEEKEKLQELHDLQERRYKLEEAQYNLEKAKQRTNLVYNGTEFVYQADTNALKEAEKALEEAKYNELINKIQDWIEAMEDAKEDFNLYDADGNLLGSTEDIIKAVKEFGDNFLDGFEKLLANNGYAYNNGEITKVQAFAEGGVVGKSDDDKFKAIAKSLGEDNLVAVKDGEMVLTKLQSNELYKKLVGTGTVPTPILDLKPVIHDNLVRVNTAPNIEVNLTGDMQFNEVQNVSDLSKAIVNGQLRGAIKQGLGRLKM